MRITLRVDGAGRDQQLALFGAVLVASSLVFHLAGPTIGSLSRFTRADVPASALMAVCPGLAAVLVARRSGGLSDLRSSVARRPRPDRSWLVAALGMPAVVLAAASLTGRGAGFEAPGWGALTLALAYVAAAVGEEVGWTAFVLPRVEPALGELAAGVTIGAGWALWHVVPHAQSGRSAWWVWGQCVFTVVLRVLLVRLAPWHRGSMWPAVAAHAGYNLAWSLSPGAGAGYDPWVAAGTTAVLTVATFIVTRSTEAGRA